MSNNYPPPPQPDQQHYNALYPSSAVAAPSQQQQQQLLDPTHQEQLQYSNLNQPLYSKTDSAVQAHNSPSTQHIQHLAQELSHHAAIDDEQHHHVQHAAHHLHPTPVTNHASGAIAHSHPPTQPDTPDQNQKTNRLRKACDSCSIRKVKCDEAGPPCRACAALDIPCTFDRPSRRRGPPNRHAEAIKRRRLEGQQHPGSPGLSGTSSPASPTHAAHALASLSGHSSAPLSAESICSSETLELLIDDFFTYIHPLCPFPHEPSFREAWKRREDLSNKSFLALLASMIGALVASFPRKPRLHIKAQKRDAFFPNHMSLVQGCQKVCAAARGPGYLDNENLNVYDAATSYFLALTGIYASQWRLGRLYFGECLTILRSLGLHKPQDQSLGTLPTATGSHYPDTRNGSGHSVDNITLEMGRRIFWTMFSSIRSMEQLGVDFGELVMLPPTTTAPHPQLPVETDDFCIYPTHTEQQPPGLLPITAGFNANVRIYTSYDALATLEMAWGNNAVIDWSRQKHVLHDSLQRCKTGMNDLPQDLTVNVAAPAGPGSEQNGGSFLPSFIQPHLSRDPAASLLSSSSRPFMDQSMEDRRRSQYDTQRANIYASSLATRTYIVEKYWVMYEAHQRSASGESTQSDRDPIGSGVMAAGVDGLLPQVPIAGQHDTIENEMREERESIVKELLVILSSIDQVNMEPNADSFIMKVRSIASTLLQAPDSRKGPIALQAQEPLSAFLKILIRLETVIPANSDVTLPEDEDIESRSWAELREYQIRFAQQSGLLGLS